MITKEQLRQLRKLMRDVELAAEEDTVGRSCGFISRDWRPNRLRDASAALDKFLDDLTEK